MRYYRRMVIIIVVLAIMAALTGAAILVPAARLLAAGPGTTGTINRVAAAPVVTLAPVNTQTSNRTAGAQLAELAANLDIETQIYETIYEKVNPSVVYIENQVRLSRVVRNTPVDALVAEGSGSGFVWNSDGYIVTNNHVVDGADGLQVTFSDGITLPAEVVGTDPGSDLAVIKVDASLVDLVPVQQGDIADVRVGSRAIAIGNPYGLVGTMTTGIVSAIGRSLNSDPNDTTSFSIPQVIQTDAAMNPGNSGGPLLNELGAVIGVNFQIRSSDGSDSGVGFSIPINIVQRVVPALIEDGKYTHAYLGIRGQTYTPAWADALGFSKGIRGAYVMDVTTGGPAQRGGLRAASKDTDVVLGVGTTGLAYLQSGGDLITAIDGQSITTFDDLLVYLENYKSPGDTVTLTVQRAGTGETTIEVKLAARPE